MDEIAKYIADLQEAVRKSTIYEGYEKAREELNRDPALKQAVNEFRGKNFALQNASESVDFYSESEKLEQKFQQLLRHPVAIDYLEKELAVCRMLQRLEAGLISAVEIEIEGFENMIS